VLSLRHCRNLRSTRGLSLLELLAVMLTMLILSALVLPGMRGLISSGNLRGSARALIAQMDLARQTADARNVRVAVRIYQDTTKATDANGHFPYRLIALVIPASASSTGNDQFLAAPMGLPGDVIVDSNVQYSSLLNPALGATGLQPVAATELASAPLRVRGLSYIQFTFLANGTVDLDPAQSWYLTLVNQTAAPSPSTNTPAANFATLILDPQTSHTRSYEP